MKKFLMIPVALLAGTLATTASAAPKISAQSIIVNPAQPDLKVSVSVNKDAGGNAIPNYRVGEQISISATTNRDAYVYLFNVDARGNVDQIRFGDSNFVKANTTAVFPVADSGLVFNIGEDTGLNKVLALASLTPLDLSQISSFKSSQDAVASVNAQGQAGLAQALSIVVNPVPQNSWVTDTAFYNVQAATPVRTGNFFVGTNVAGSTVILNGRTLGAANVTYTGITPGNYPVRVKAPGYPDFTTTVRIAENTTVNLNVEFAVRPAPITAPAPVVSTPVTGQVSFTINSALQGARVFIDGNEVGRTDRDGLTVLLSRGAHEVVMLAPGYRTYVNTVSLSNNTSLTINPTR